MTVELARFDAEVEGDERGEELRPRQAELAEHAGEPHAVQQAEGEHQRGAPRLQRRS